MLRCEEPKFISEKQASKLKIATLRKIIVTLNQIMNYAVRHEYIDHNPVRDAERPRSQGHDDQLKIRVLNPDEIQALIDAATNQKYKTLFMLTIMSGARQGEILGLKWSDIDWINSQIHIQRTFNKGAWYKA